MVCSDFKEFRIGVILMIISLPVLIMTLDSAMCQFPNMDCSKDQKVGLPLWITLPSSLSGAIGMILVLTTKEQTTESEQSQS